MHGQPMTHQQERDQIIGLHSVLRPLFTDAAPQTLRHCDWLLSTQLFEDGRYETDYSVPSCIARERELEESCHAY